MIINTVTVGKTLHKLLWVKLYTNTANEIYLH